MRRDAYFSCSQAKDARFEKLSTERTSPSIDALKVQLQRLASATLEPYVHEPYVHEPYVHVRRKRPLKSRNADGLACGQEINGKPHNVEQ